MQDQIPDQAQVVVVGGGVAGCSIAYHLSELGIRDVLLLERHQLTSGTSWHAAGLVMQLRSTRVMTEISRYAVELYSKLEADGLPTGLRLTGSLPIARDSDRLHEIRRLISLGRRFGIDVHEVTANEIAELYPMMDVGQVCGGAFIPRDGQTNPVDTTMALAKAARKNGVKIIEGATVTALEVVDDRVDSLVCNGKTIKCETVVLSCGLWSDALAMTAGVRVPLHACEHMYVVTDKIDALAKNLPVIRDTDGSVYIKEDAGKLLVGSFEPRGLPLPVDRLPADTPFIELQAQWDHFLPMYESAAKLVPPLHDAPIKTFMNGPESFTTDTRFILGPFPTRPNLFVAAGFNSQGILSGAGVGRVIAHWVAEGHAPMDLSGHDIARFHDFQSNARYRSDRVSETLGFHYLIHWPHRQFETCRPLRVTAFHERLKAKGACFGEATGWDRANWFARDGQEPVYRHSFRRANWFDVVGEEHQAAREGVALFDMSSFGKIIATGPSVVHSLQRICANDVDVPVGRIVYTQCLNPRGGIEADLTVNRLADDRYMIVTSAASQSRDLNWLRNNTPRDEATYYFDATSSYSVLAVMGPHSRDLIQELTPESLANDAFPFSSSREIDLCFAKVLACRISYVGELGWELYIPTEFSLAIFDELVAHGERYGLRFAGYHALDSLRLEKGYRHWGADITPDDTPLESGLRFALKTDGDIDFIGRSALEAQERDGIRKRCVFFRTEDEHAALFHDEPILFNGEYVGEITSGGFGYTIGTAIGLGFVDSGVAFAAGTMDQAFEIEIECERFKASASLSAFYDPKGLRLRS